MSERVPNKSPQPQVLDQSYNSNTNLLANVPQSNLEISTEQIVQADNYEKKVMDGNGVHQKSNYSSGVLSGTDDKNETDTGEMLKSEVKTTASSGVEIAVGPIKSAFSALQQRIFETENELQKLEIKFYTIVSRKSVELEGINEDNEKQIENHRHLYEMQEIQRLEAKLRYLEQEKIKLLKKEMTGTARLTYKSKIHGNHLDEIESIYETEARKRELTITKLYSRFNNDIARQIELAEGSLEVVERRRDKPIKDENVLFDGIRDKKLMANWNQTPQPIVVKLMTSRCMRDKVPKGDYIVRACVMDRLVDNKLYYKFVEYGQRVKEQKRVDKEFEYRAKTGIDINALRKQITNIGYERKNGDIGNIQDVEEAKDVEHQRLMNENLFGSNTNVDLEQSNKKGVRWGEDVKEKHHNTFTKPVNSGVISNNLGQTKIGFDMGEYDELYKDKNAEKVWLDFGKVTTQVINYDPFEESNIQFVGHKMYFMLPPESKLQPSNIILFELVYISGKDPSKDSTVGWGALPIVNGDFLINTGKFKVPMIYGDVDFSSNKFKDLEQKYIRNVDEWLCNLYIEVRKIQIFDFRKHEEKIEFVVPKKLQRLLAQQRDRTEQISIEREIVEKLDPEDVESDYSSDASEGNDSADEWDTGDPKQVFITDTKVIKYADYKYCVNRSEEEHKILKISTDNNSFRRTLFILFEIVNDLGIEKSTLFQNFLTVLIAFSVLWFRMFIHYIGQYLLLKSINAPVSSLTIDWYKLNLVYASWNVYQEMGVTAIGPLSNSILFIFFMAVCHISNKYIYCFPVIFCKIIAWYGLLTIMDFAFTVVVDCAFMDNNGDLFKLYNYYEKSENSGTVGLFVTVLIQFAITIFNVWLAYNYIAFVHCDARIEDIYIRISGFGKGYYLPDDNEVSWSYLRQTYYLGEINNNRIVVNPLKIPNTYSGGYRFAKSYQFQRFINETSVTLDQVFFARENGQIIAVNFDKMNMFRSTTLHKLIEDTQNWTYKKRVIPEDPSKIRRKMTVAKSFGIDQSSVEGNEDAANRKKSNTGGANQQRRGTINLIKNLMRHKVNIINENEYDRMSRESEENEGDALRKILQQKMKDEALKKNRKGMGGSIDDDDLINLDSQEEDEVEDWNNYRTGGPVAPEEAKIEEEVKQPTVAKQNQRRKV